ncbi:MAG: 16S rRNA (guanine(966)-N(2))-methyltransferase RsmD [Candidatus Omnitrophota bacterium]|nr:16S rRNA (guanine(966)-N(2))-methyltransferase RsmD [Candidatus Omnitrophota bacterium]
MKIIAGEYKGRVIEMPKGIRPTSDKVREALFEILKGNVEGANFLDLYCGSGAMGIEALSRGAKKSVFIDNSNASISIVKRNLAKLAIPETLYDIYNKDCIDILRRGGFQTLPYDIVFLDPPYYKDMAKNTLIELSSCDILTPYAVVVAEVFKKEALPEDIGVFRKTRSYKYGDTLLEFYKK